MRRWTFVLIPAFAACLLLVFVLSANSRQRDALAASGAIDNGAPVRASIEAVIQTPPEKVWSMLSDIDNWPRWQSGIPEAKIDGPLQNGATFNWTTGGMHIRSRLALVVPSERLAWTGFAMGAHAIHVLNLERLPAGRTRVRVDESMSGFLLSLFYLSNDLRDGNRLWLDRLKQESER